MQNNDTVQLVDEQDRPLRLMGKLAAHESGVLHRAFSAYVFQVRAGQRHMLLQKRAVAKYHFGGLWTNACCGHPLEGTSPAEAGMRRLFEEMNIRCELRAVGSFIYRAESANSLIEHELDHVLVGTFEGELPAPNPLEADGARWISLDALAQELAQAPESFTPWFSQGYAVIRAAERERRGVMPSLPA
jgi:isopentenyl-diphosphate Delta-isomerase